jgi:hypothetical protein
MKMGTGFQSTAPHVAAVAVSGEAALKPYQMAKPKQEGESQNVQYPPAGFP